MKISLILSCLFLVVSASAAEKVFILVPGFFNSAIPSLPLKMSLPEMLNPWEQPYFSKDVINVFKKEKVRVHVVKNLSPLGGIRENGELLADYLEQVPCSSCEMTIIGHSAGGLYALWALSHKNFPVKKLITLSTPYGGLKFLESLNQNVPGLESALNFFWMENLVNLTADKVAQELSQIKIQQTLVLEVHAGYQSTSLFINDWENLSWPLAILQQLADGPSDGIVTVKSSLSARGYDFGPQVHMQIVEDLIPIEHWEMAADSRFFRFLNVWNYQEIAFAQRELFRGFIK